jgi:uncharacterized protein with HEPN domain
VTGDRAYVEHILHCIGRIQDYSRDGRAAVLARPVLQDAIIRNLQVLCESTQRLSDAGKARYPDVDWRGMSGLRNVTRERG